MCKCKLKTAPCKEKPHNIQLPSSSQMDRHKKVGKCGVVWPPLHFNLDTVLGKYGCCVLWAKEIKKNLDRYQHKSQKPASVMGCKICKSTIAETYIHTLKQNMLPSKWFLFYFIFFKGCPCFFQQDHTKLHSAGVLTEYLHITSVWVLDWCWVLSNWSHISNKNWKKYHVQNFNYLCPCFPNAYWMLLRKRWHNTVVNIRMSTYLQKQWKTLSVWTLNIFCILFLYLNQYKLKRTCKWLFFLIYVLHHVPPF